MRFDEPLHLVVAFCGEAARGNPTGVILGEPGGWPEARCQRLAARLGLPDTAFLEPVGEGRWRARFFSPAQPLALCVQALLASHAVVGGPEACFDTATGEVLTRSDASDPGLAWALFPRERVYREAGSVQVGERLGLALDARSEAVVDSGRRRVFVELPGAVPLAALRGPASAVLELCRETGLQGLCFYTRTGPGTLALRVFTPSLDGNEDVATGGAVLGLAALVEPEVRWRVSQGGAAYHQRGELWLEPGWAEGMVGVGGRVERVGQGRLLSLNGPTTHPS